MPARATRRALIGVGVFLLCVAGYYAWMLWQVSHDLTEAGDAAHAARQAVAEGDDQGVARAVEDLSEHSSAAADITGGVTWAVLEQLPGFGDDAAAVEQVSDVLSDLSGQDVTALLQTDLGALVPRDGAVDVEALRAMREQVSDGHDSLAAARDQLADHDPDDLVGPLRSRFEELESEIDSATETFGTADTALQLLPTMLGADEKRRYLLVLQNNAELRSTGGLPGAALLLEAENGRVSAVRQVAGNSFERTAEPVLPLTKAETEIYSPVMGTYFLNAGMTPDFPRAAALWRARWEQRYAEQLDGVLTVDPVALSYLLRAVGPVEAAGMQLNADNVVDQLLHQVYLDHPEPAEQDRVFEQVARVVFDRVTSGAGDPQGVVRALHQGVTERRIMVTSFHEGEQRRLSGTTIAGELVTTAEEGDGPQVGVYLNDATGAKMSYFLRPEVRVGATSCTGGVQRLGGELSLASEAPLDAGEKLPSYVTGGGENSVQPGTQWVAVRLYGPVSGEITDVLVNGAPAADVAPVDHDGRPVVTVLASLAPQQQVDVKWTMVAGPGQTGDPQVRTTPGLGSGIPSGGASACRPSSTTDHASPRTPAGAVGTAQSSEQQGARPWS